MIWRRALSVGGLALGLASIARAEPPGLAPRDAGIAAGLRLEWHAPEGCPVREDVLAQVAVLAADEAVTWTRFERVRAAIRPAAGAHRLEIELVASDGVRRRLISGERCGDLATAAAVAIVLAHRSSEGGAPSEHEASSEGAPLGSGPERAAGLGERPAAPGVGSPAAAGSSRADGGSLAAPSPSLMLHLQGAIDPGTLGGAALGAAAGVSLSLGALSGTFYGAAFPSVTTSVAGRQAIALALWTGGLRGCHRWGRGLDTCALLEIGQVRAKGVALARAATARDLWVAPGLSIGFRSTPFDGFGITTELAAFRPLVRGRFRVDESEVVHQIPALGFRALLGLDVSVL